LQATYVEVSEKNSAVESPELDQGFPETEDVQVGTGESVSNQREKLGFIIGADYNTYLPLQATHNEVSDGNPAKESTELVSASPGREDIPVRTVKSVSKRQQNK